MRHHPDLAAPDLLGAARACYGALLVCAPRRMVSFGARHPAGSRAVAVTRVLGARHLLQAALTAGVVTAAAPSAGLPPGTVLLAGSAVDAVHAASMIGLAAGCRPYRRSALADVLLEAGFAAFGIMTARYSRQSPYPRAIDGRLVPTGGPNIGIDLATTGATG